MRLLVLLALAACGNVANDPRPDAIARADASPADVSIDGATCVTPPASLRARWRADGNAKDDTGMYNGTTLGGLGYTPGKHGMAFLFDGADDAITADPSDQLYPAGSFSVELWFKTNHVPTDYAALIQKYDCGGADACAAPDWEIDLSSTGFIQFGVRVVGGPSATVTASTSSVVDNSWHHVAGVRDIAGSQLELYVDGALVVSSALDSSFAGAMTNADGAPDLLTIGAQRRSGVDTIISSYAGAIDETAYYISALSADDIAAIYSAPLGACP